MVAQATVPASGQQMLFRPVMIDGVTLRPVILEITPR